MCICNEYVQGTHKVQRTKKFNGFWIEIENGEHSVNAEDIDGNWMGFDIEFCPFCGRKLNAR